MLVRVPIAVEKEVLTSFSFFEYHREIFQATSNRAGTDKALNHARSWVERDASNVGSGKTMSCIRGRIVGEQGRSVNEEVLPLPVFIYRKWRATTAVFSLPSPRILSGCTGDDPRQGRGKHIAFSP